MPTKLNALARVSHHPPPTDYKALAGRKARIYQTEQEGELVFILLDKSVDKSSPIETEATFGSHLSALESQIAELKSLLLSHNSRSLIQAPTRFELNRLAEREIVTRYGPLISRNVHPHTFKHGFAINSVRHEVQVCVYCGGNGSIDLATCHKCIEKGRKHVEIL